MDEASVALQQPRSSPPAWTPGEYVRVRGNRWRVEGCRVYADCELLHLAGAGGGTRGRHLAVLYPFDRPRRLDLPAGLRLVRPRAWVRAFRALAGRATPFGRLRQAASARIDLHAYQLEPALAVLNGLATRVLVADEVGLGKTIQAGLLVAELHARDPAARTLVLTPAGLRDQWASELRARFAVQAEVVDAAAVRRTTAQVADGANPWSVWPVIVASLDFVKRREVLRALDSFTWDLLVVDEAHASATAPDRSAAVNTLAERARLVVLLTATPHAGDDRAFEALCEIGRLPNPAEAGSHIMSGSGIVMFRRARADVGLPSDRRVHLVRVRGTSAEQRMHRLLERYARAVWSSPDAGPDARLAMVVLTKRALSSAASLARSVERRLDALFDSAPAGDQMVLPFAGTAAPDEQTPEDEEPIGPLGAPGMDSRRERGWLTRILDAARVAAERESKTAQLSRLLRRAREPAIVFTEYRDTARRLAALLAPIGPVALLHGALSRAERLDAERAFRTGAAAILVATDAAGEGLNLQHRCRLVVNLELPWNPMRLEQRVGRVDRLGQQRRPHAIHLVAAATAEERIVRRLVVRQTRAQRAVGRVADAIGAAGVEDVTQAVMAGQIQAAGTAGRIAPTFAGVSEVDLRAVARDEVCRVQAIRRVVASGEHGHGRAVRSSEAAIIGGPPLWILRGRRARRSGLPAGLLCIFSVRLFDRDESEVIDESVVGLHLDLRRTEDGGPGTRDRGPRTTDFVERLARSTVLRDRALTAAGERLGAVVARRAAACVARDREVAMAAAARRHLPPLQPGMFDRRVERRAEDEEASRSARQFDQWDRVAQLDRRLSAEPVRQAELVLVLLVER